MLICLNCNKEFPNKIIDKDGQIHYLTGRKFCPTCSPIGNRNTRSYIVNLKENEAFCARCEKVKQIKQFYIRNNGKPFSYCIDCQDDVKRIKFEENLERIVEIHGGSCSDCGISYPLPVYEFFLNNELYPISKAKNMSFENLYEKLKNYTLLCKNCCAIRKWQIELK